MRFSSQNSNFDTQQITEQSKRLTEYINKLNQVRESKNYELPEGSINLPTDEELLQKVKEVISQKVSKNLKYIIDIGIGGSNLGTKAVYDGLFGFFDLVKPDNFPKMFFADTSDPQFLSNLASLIRKITNKEEVLINLISKSGTTTESIFNAEVVLTAFKNIDPNFERLVITSDKNSKLWDFAQKKNISTLEIPKTVGGRYSVFSAVGLFPLLAAGIDIESLRKGASDIVAECLKNSQDNPALTSAIIIYLSTRDGKNINDNFFFLPELESVGKWYRQLMAESLGKDGKKVPTPTVSIGSTDLHSMVQLYLGGPKDKVTTFISSENSKKDLSIPSDQIFTGFIDGIAGKNASEIMKAILEGVKIAYSKKGLPYMEIVIETLNEYEIGQFMQFKMIEMMFLGQLFEVNAFDQPNVEDYKVETKKLLNSH